MRHFFLLAIIVGLLCGLAAAQLPLKQSTATSITLGPFVDATDGYTRETALDVNGWSCSIIKGVSYDTIAVADGNTSNDAVHLGQGFYSLELTATNTNTLGTLIIDVNDPSAMAVTARFIVYPADSYDMLFSEGPGDANDIADAVQVGVTAQGYTTARAVEISSIYQDTNSSLPNSLSSLRTEIEGILAAINNGEVTGVTGGSSGGWIKRSQPAMN